jgi:hypothetical protein
MCLSSDFITDHQFIQNVPFITAVDFMLGVVA